MKFLQFLFLMVFIGLNYNSFAQERVSYSMKKDDISNSYTKVEIISDTTLQHQNSGKTQMSMYKNVVLVNNSEEKSLPDSMYLKQEGLIEKSKRRKNIQTIAK